MIMFIFVGGIIFSRFLIVAGLPQQLSMAIEQSQMPPVVILIGVTIMYIVLGMFIDQASMCIITIPIVFPIMVSLGYDPIWFGVYFVILGNLAQVTPPVGLVCYVMKGTVPDCTLGEVFAGVAPFFVVEIIALIIMAAFPVIATFLPYQMMG